MLYKSCCNNKCDVTLQLTLYGDRVGTAVKVLCYKLEGRWFDPHDIVPTKERLQKIRIAVAVAIGRTPHSTALRNVALVDISGNAQRKDSRSCYEWIHDGYRKNGYSGHTSHSGHRSATVLYCGCWRNLWGFDRSLSGT